MESSEREFKTVCKGQLFAANTILLANLNATKILLLAIISLLMSSCDPLVTR